MNGMESNGMKEVGDYQCLWTLGKILALPIQYCCLFTPRPNSSWLVLMSIPVFSFILILIRTHRFYPLPMLMVLPARRDVPY